MRYEHIARAVFNAPWFIHEREGQIITSRVLERIDGLRLSDDELVARITAAQAAQGPRGAGGRRAAGPVGVIGVYGVLMPRATLMSEMSGGTSVARVRASLREALADDAIKSILFDVDSPGGSVEGIEELASEIREARGQKPMVAVSNHFMASAAYYLAAQADEIVVSPSSRTGSIGVFMEHVEFSKANEAEGVTATVIRRPDGKHDVNDVEPLSDPARAALQEMVDDYYDQFVTAVAKGRGVTAAAVRAGYGQGRALTARRAVAAGLADRVGTFDETVERLQAGRGPMPGRVKQEDLAAAFGFSIEEYRAMPAENRAAAAAAALIEGRVSVNQVRALENLEPAPEPVAEAAPAAPDVAKKAEAELALAKARQQIRR